MVKTKEEMCLTNNEVTNIVEKHLQQHKASLEKVLALQFENVMNTLNSIQLQVGKINGRVGDSERKIRTLEDHGLVRDKDCPYREDIQELKRKYVHDIGLEAFQEEENKKREAEARKRERSSKLFLGIIAAAIALFNVLANYFIR